MILNDLLILSTLKCSEKEYKNWKRKYVKGLFAVSLLRYNFININDYSLLNSSSSPYDNNLMAYILAYHNVSSEEMANTIGIKPSVFNRVLDSGKNISYLYMFIYIATKHVGIDNAEELYYMGLSKRRRRVDYILDKRLPKYTVNSYSIEQRYIENIDNVRFITDRSSGYSKQDIIDISDRVDRGMIILFNHTDDKNDFLLSNKMLFVSKGYKVFGTTSSARAYLNKTKKPRMVKFIIMTNDYRELTPSDCNIEAIIRLGYPKSLDSIVMESSCSNDLDYYLFKTIYSPDSVEPIVDEFFHSDDKNKFIVNNYTI